jgi:DNA invertase Pin-like site-specific DNA recombinase
MDTLDHFGYHEFVAHFRELMRYAVKSPGTSTPAYSYLRFSTDAQAEGDSVRRQTALRDAWLKRHPEVRLDTSLVDRGVSGYTGAHRKNGKHALAAFVDLAKRGRVPAGSYLIVENLDRLTREQPVDSIPAVLELIKIGVRVVQLAPSEVVYSADMDQGALMMMLWELSRGHGESKRKSGLCGEAWAEKKRQAREGKAPHGGSVPAWLELTPAGYRVREDAGRAVRLIFKFAAGGLGILAIAARLNAEGVPPLGCGDRWKRSYVQKILASRTVLGEYQPHKGSRKRTPEGDPVVGYFPPVITEAEWHAAQQAKESRHRRTGRPSGAAAAPFAGLLRCALDGCPLHTVVRGKCRRRYLVSADAATGEPVAHWRPFPLDVLQDALLSRLAELRAADLFDDPGAGKVADLTGRVGEVERRLAAALARFEADPESQTWQAQVTKYDREKRQLVRELAEARQAAAHPLSAQWEEAVELMRAEDPVRLRQAILATVAEVRCLFVPRGQDRLAAVQVWFRGEGGAHRDYVILHRPRQFNGKTRTTAPGCRKVGSWTDKPPIDLRQPDHARALEAELLAVDLAKLEAKLQAF